LGQGSDCFWIAGDTSGVVESAAHQEAVLDRVPFRVPANPINLNYFPRNNSGFEVHMKRLRLYILGICFVFMEICLAQTAAPTLLQRPTLSKTAIAFSFAGDLWTVPREGGEARLLTSGAGDKTDPVFSSDGSMIAFTGDYDGNVDVYVMPADGGVPKRLTHHPSIDEVVGWTPDGKSVLFRSGRNSYSRFNRLFTVSIEGGLPRELPLPMAEAGSFSADGKRIAYVPRSNFRRLSGIAWRRYRGGLAPQVWIADLSDSSIVEVPHETSQDWNPMWVGDRVYFISDRNGAATLYEYDLNSRQVKELLKSNGQDIKSASAGPGGIVYEQFGSLHLFDTATGTEKRISIRVPADLPGIRPHFARIADEIENYSLSPSGARAVFEAHGEILTVPAEKGDVRNLTNTPGVAERDPAWSPNGKWVAYFSDQASEYELHLRAPDGMGDVKTIALGNPPSFFYSPVWSPDSTKIAYHDKRLSLWYVDVSKGSPVKVDTDTYDAPERTLDPAWSPDSKWIAYTKRLPSHMHVVCVYSLEKGTTLQVTDGLSDARFPIFDRDGKYLYFTASTDSGPTTGWLDLSSFNRPVTRNVYITVLQKDAPSPLAPESDEEKQADEKKPNSDKAEAPASDENGEKEPAAAEAAAKKKDANVAKAEQKKPPVVVQIDSENIGQRILALPIPARNYVGMWLGKSGTLFLAEQSPIFSRRSGPEPESIYRFELGTRKADKLLEGIAQFTVSFDGKKMLYSKGDQEQKWFTAKVPDQKPEGAPGPGQSPDAKPLNLDSAMVYVEPRAEWAQMYNEVWRIERDYFYDPKLHGLDLAAARTQYRPYLETLGSRQDLSYLFGEMLGDITVGHLYIRTPQHPDPHRARGGLLGADYSIEKWTLPLRQGLLRRELESRIARAAYPTRRECSTRGLPAGRERAGIEGLGRNLPALRRDRRKGSRLEGR
jgi:tricorn protease